MLPLQFIGVFPRFRIIKTGHYIDKLLFALFSLFLGIGDVGEVRYHLSAYDCLSCVLVVVYSLADDPNEAE